MTPEHEQYRRRHAEQKAKYKNQFLERWLGWSRNPSDRFAALIAVFTFGLFAATAGLWIATKDLVEDARASGRAWVGPTNAFLTAMEPSQPIKATITYGNFGRQPAPTNFLSFAKIYSIQQWNDGTAVREIESAKDACMAVNGINRGAHITYPTSGGAGFSVNFESNDPQNDPAVHFFGTQGLVAGQDVFMIRGCMIYETVGTIHHSVFCYYYRFPTTDRQHLGYCNVGQAAD